MPRRSKPLRIAPAIPLLGIVGILGIDELQRTRYLVPFVVVWSVLLVALFGYVFNKMLEARRARGR
jgi:hypothetical protein